MTTNKFLPKFTEEMAQAFWDEYQKEDWSLERAFKAMCAEMSASETMLNVEALVEALEGLLGVIDESRGVSGYHLNGEIAEWDEFQAVHDATAALATYRKQGVAEARSAGNYERMDKAATEALGFTLPHDWNGNVQVQGNVTAMIDGKEHVEPAAALGVEPTFWGVYAQLEDGRHYWLADFNTQEQAEELAERLGLIAAHRKQGGQS